MFQMLSRRKMGIFTLFVDNLPINMTNVWLKQLFKNVGEVTDAFVSKKKRKGVECPFGFVRFKREVEAREAIRMNNNLEVKGKKLVVMWSKYARTGEWTQGVPNQREGAANRDSYLHRRSFAEVVTDKIRAHQSGDEKEGQRVITSGRMVIEKQRSKWVEMEEKELVKEWVKRLVYRGCIEEKLVIEVEGKEVVVHSFLSNLNGSEKVKKDEEDSKPMTMGSGGERTMGPISEVFDQSDSDKVGEGSQDDCTRKRALVVNNGEGKEYSDGTTLTRMDNGDVTNFWDNKRSMVRMKSGDPMDSSSISSSSKLADNNQASSNIDKEGVVPKTQADFLMSQEDPATDGKKYFKEKDDVKESLEYEVSTMREEYLQIQNQKEENMFGRFVNSRRSTRKRVPRVFHVGRKESIIKAKERKRQAARTMKKFLRRKRPDLLVNETRRRSKKKHLTVSLDPNEILQFASVLGLEIEGQEDVIRANIESMVMEEKARWVQYSEQEQQQ